MIRKTLIALLTLATFLSGTLWALSYAPTSWRWGYRSGRLDAWLQRGLWSVDIRNDEEGSRTHIGVRKGGVVIIHSIKIDPSEVVKNREFRWGVVRIFRGIPPRQTGGCSLLYMDKTYTPEELRRMAMKDLWWTFGTRLWVPFVLSAIYPTLVLIGGPLRRRRRRGTGRCIKCGYNLTGLSEPRCPECGEPFASAASTENPPFLR
jgi:hypothetical protein